MALTNEEYINKYYKYESNFVRFETRSARFMTKLASDMKYNGEIVEVLGVLKGKDISSDRYIVRFKNNKIRNNIYNNELNFHYVRKNINKNKERDVR